MAEMFRYNVTKGQNFRTLHFCWCRTASLIDIDGRWDDWFAALVLSAVRTFVVDLYLEPLGTLTCADS